MTAQQPWIIGIDLRPRSDGAVRFGGWLQAQAPESVKLLGVHALEHDEDRYLHSREQVEVAIEDTLERAGVRAALASVEVSAADRPETALESLHQAMVSAAMGHPGEDAGDVLDNFIRGLGMPRSLREVKVGADSFDRIAQQAMHTPWVPRNPRKIEGPAQVREILELAA